MSASIDSRTPESDRDRRRNDPAWQQIRAERAIAAPHTGHFEWWIVFEAVFVFSAWVAVGLAGVAGWIPYWVSVPIASLLAFSAYMPLHEAAHRNVHGQSAGRGWVRTKPSVTSRRSRCSWITLDIRRPTWLITPTQTFREEIRI